ncbi:hypothetical protein IAT38_007613 [Cryptococcus sp. DSM 104549]
MAPMIFDGIVTKCGAMRKTATVTVERIVPHPKIGKPVKQHKKYLVHDEAEVARLDDKVKIIQSATLMSPRKSFRLHAIVQRNLEAHPGPIPTEFPPPHMSPSKTRRRAAKILARAQREEDAVNKAANIMAAKKAASMEQGAVMKALGEVQKEQKKEKKAEKEVQAEAEAEGKLEAEGQVAPASA